MSDFHTFATAVHTRYNEMAKNELFEVDITPDEIWAAYLAAFPEGTNPVFRINTEHDCSCCRNFIKNLGRVITLGVNGERKTVWGLWEDSPAPYNEVGHVLSTLVLRAKIKSVYRTKEHNYGAEQSRELRADGSVHVWKHFHGKVALKHRSDDADTIRGKMNTTAQVFQRGLEELRVTDVMQVLQLIDAKALYRGEEHKAAVVEFQKLQHAYKDLHVGSQERDDFVWANLSSPAARFRNTVIGTLVQDLSSDMPIEQAVRAFETKVAPANYKRPTALITPRMIEDAMKTIEGLDLQDSLRRRFANISDVSVNNVLWVDNKVKPLMKDGLQGLLLSSVKPSTKATDPRATIVGIDSFMRDILPTATSIDLLVQNKHAGNFVSLTANDDERAARLFKWDNRFAWSYDGNITDSIRERVKSAGGNVDGKLRFSLAWHNTDDLDLHVFTPGGAHIYYAARSGQGGRLDVDANGINGIRPDPVENVAFAIPADGVYKVTVNQFSKRQNHDVGFTLQAATEGQVMEFTYPHAVSGNNVIGEFHVRGGQIVDFKYSDALTLGSTPKEKWGITTEQPVKVRTVMFSPNYWDDNAVGNKHWIFVLDGCKNPEPARGIYNEFLRSELDQHRKVFEILGEKTKCPVVDDQLSGVGFSSTKREEVQATVHTATGQRTYKIQF
jgi:hypothetical protein